MQLEMLGLDVTACENESKFDPWARHRRCCVGTLHIPKCTYDAGAEDVLGPNDRAIIAFVQQRPHLLFDQAQRHH